MARIVRYLPLLIAMSVPGAAAAGVQIAVHCADLPEAKAGGPSADIAWFEVYFTGDTMKPGREAQRLGHFTADELNDSRAKCRVDGHDYAIGLSDYVVKDQNWMQVEYRTGLWMDGYKVWPEPNDKSGDSFMGTIRVDYRSVSICSIREHSSGHGAAAFGQARPRVPTLSFSAQTGADQTCNFYETAFP